MSELGRISGPLLKSNLLRNGADLAVETDLLYIDVTNKRIGINTAAPTQDLTVVTTTNIALDIIASNSAQIGNIVFGNDGSINTGSGTLTLTAVNGIVAPALTTDNLLLSNNTINVTTPNTDLVVNATAVNIRSNSTINGNLDVTGNINITHDLHVYGYLYLGSGSNAEDDITFDGPVSYNIYPTITNRFKLGYADKKWKNIYAVLATINQGSLNISTNTISTGAGNTTISLNGNGNGGVFLNNLFFKNTTLSSSNNNPLAFSLSNKTLVINSTASLNIPVTSKTAYPSPQQGDLYFSTTDTKFKGFGTSNITFSGVYSDNEKTRITANNSSINFFVNDLQIATLDSTTLTLPQLNVSDLVLSSDNISISLPTDITFASNGGFIKIENLKFSKTITTETITNTSADPSENLLLSSTGTRGYVKFNSTTGMVIPSGDSSSRVNIVTPPVGTTRFNTDLNYLESFDGSLWHPSIGDNPLLSNSEIQDRITLYSIMLGA